jgi:hypothetical protein
MTSLLLDLRGLDIDIGMHACEARVANEIIVMKCHVNIAPGCYCCCICCVYRVCCGKLASSINVHANNKLCF